MAVPLPSRFCALLGPVGAAGDRQHRIGGKARSLLRLREAGLPVPPALAVTTDLFRAMRAGGPPLPATLDAPGALEALAHAGRALRSAPWPNGFLAELDRALASLPDGGRLSVRSSADAEDDPDALGAGVYTSRVEVARRDVEDALRDVLASALAPGVVAYLRARGRSADPPGMAVLIHPYVAAPLAGTAALDAAPGARAVIDANAAVPPAVTQRLTAALTALRARHGGVEVEWAATADAPVFLQLRPHRPGHSARTELPGGDPDWRWDAAHNPLPLSSAQAGLVEFVDARGAVPFAQRVVDGYLFYRAQPAAVPLATDPRRALADLRQRADGLLARPQALEAALETFAAIYEPLFAVVQPAARAARQALAARLTELGLAAAELLPGLLSGVSSAASARAAAAERLAAAANDSERASARDAYAAAFGDESPVWDVAVPTWGERPQDIPFPPVRGTSPHGAPVAAQIRQALPEADRPRWDQLVAAAREAAAVAEDDDALYARAQAHVRRALLAEGERLVREGVLDGAADVFWLPFELVRRLARREATLTGAEAGRLVEQARAADARARAAPPTLAAVSGQGPGVLVRGRGGSPGARIGVVRRWPLHDAPGATNEPPVVVAPTILPTELPLMAASALVVETGGVLDHVAAQARERGIPAVVGAAGAMAALSDGDRVLVDGDAGVVVRLPGGR